KLEPYPTEVGTATSGVPDSPATTEGRAPSIPATTTRASASSNSGLASSSRCSPATPTSLMRTGEAPKQRMVTSASAATHWSEVPAAITATVPVGRGIGPRVAVAETWYISASGSSATTAPRASGPSRVASTGRPGWAVCSRRSRATTCAGVLPVPKTTSGSPVRRARCRSSRAHASDGSGWSSLTSRQPIRPRPGGRYSGPVSNTVSRPADRVEEDPTRAVRYGFLGPEATFTHQALLQFDDRAESVPFPDVLATLDAVHDGTV